MMSPSRSRSTGLYFGRLQLSMPGDEVPFIAVLDVLSGES